ncbi:MAG: hypothetical protein QXU98_07170 [Candidatus Parvarchaeota archaeon]
MKSEIKKSKPFTLAAMPEELKHMKEKADKFGLPVSRLLILRALNWDGRIKND